MSFPMNTAGIIGQLRESVPGIERAVLSTHCHNDLGMAVANRWPSVRQRRTRRSNAPSNGLGERAGNAALEEIVMAIHTRPDFFGSVTTGVKTTEIPPHQPDGLAVVAASPSSRTKSIVGANAFAHEAGIHVDGIVQKPPDLRNHDARNDRADGIADRARAPLGRSAIADRCKKLGYTLGKEEIDAAYRKFLEIADKKKEVFDEDLAAIIGEEIRESEQVYKLEISARLVRHRHSAHRQREDPRQG